ncbi:hypothetical protein PMIN07_008399 [Paraphaeosphaeria minitans]
MRITQLQVKVKAQSWEELTESLLLCSHSPRTDHSFWFIQQRTRRVSSTLTPLIVKHSLTGWRRREFFSAALLRRKLTIGSLPAMPGIMRCVIATTICWSQLKTAQKLVCVAKEIFAGDITGDDLEVHFHLAPLDIGAMTCTARLVPQFWNRGDYFTSDFTMTDELHLYAHIELRTESTILANTGRPTFYQSVMEPASFKAAMELLDMQPVFSQPHRSQGDSINQHQLGESVIPIGPLQPLDLSFWESPSTELEVAKRQPELENEPRKKSKRKTRAELKSESESEPIGRRTRASKPAYTRPIPEPALYPTLPVDATPENLLKDKEAYRSDNTRDEFLTTGRDISSFCKSRKDMIAKARLQAGKYGVVARKPCDHCESRKKSCRVFHPALYHEPFITNIWWKKSVGSLQTRCACCTAENKVQCNFCY